MKKAPLVSYLIILAVLCAIFATAAGTLGRNGVYLAQAYMFTPAVAAFLARLFFYKPRFTDANLRLGKAQDFFTFWLLSLGITALSYLLFTVSGAVTWDWSGQSFLERLALQFSAAGKNIQENLPPGFTPRTMLILFFLGGLTVFNILPGLLNGFGEEFGHRGFMFPLLYRINPWASFIGGGLIWYAWHLPLAFLIPQNVSYPLWQTVLNHIALIIGSICAFTYLAFVYVKSRSVWVTSLAHITMNNAGQSFSYFTVLHDQFLANVGLVLTMLIVVGFLRLRGGFDVFQEYFASEAPGDATPEAERT